MHHFGDRIWSALQQLSSISQLGTFVAVAIGYFSYRGTIRQKRTADNRDAWWHRVQRAMDSALSEDAPRKATGLAALEGMQDSPLADDFDQKLLTRIAYSIAFIELSSLPDSDAENYTGEDEEGVNHRE